MVGNPKPHPHLPSKLKAAFAFLSWAPIWRACTHHGAFDHGKVWIPEVVIGGRTVSRLAEPSSTDKARRPASEVVTVRAAPSVKLHSHKLRMVRLLLSALVSAVDSACRPDMSTCAP